MLTKQCWNLLKNADSLAARVLKGCYFPRTYFLNVHLASFGSFLWKSLMWGLDLFGFGLHWRVGGGSSILTFQDKWILRPSSFQLVCPSRSSGLATVNMLKTASRAWNTAMIRDTFAPIDADAILSIHLASSRQDDTLIWYYESSGSFSVMSSYFLGMSTMASPSCSGLSGDESWWKVLWRMSLPPRVKIFLWKASRNWLPTRGNLFAHKVPLHNICPLCMQA
ncbi:hypothetical protein ACOSQ3_014524 [Xanthoceras sorbifolium]